MTKRKIKIEEDRGREAGEQEEEKASPAAETASVDIAERAVDVEARLARAEEEIAAYRDSLMRLQAEFENYRKRQAKERQEQQKKAGEKVVRELLTVLDNLERAVGHAEDADPSALADGVRLVLKQFRESLDAFGVKPIPALGEVFDPHLHEAMSRVETEGDPPDGTVVEEYRKGYFFHDRVLRPAMVGVAKIVDGASEEA